MSDETNQEELRKLDPTDLDSYLRYYQRQIRLGNDSADFIPETLHLELYERFKKVALKPLRDTITKAIISYLQQLTILNNPKPTWFNNKTPPYFNTDTRQPKRGGISFGAGDLFLPIPDMIADDIYRPQIMEVVNNELSKALSGWQFMRTWGTFGSFYFQLYSANLADPTDAGRDPQGSPMPAPNRGYWTQTGTDAKIPAFIFNLSPVFSLGEEAEQADYISYVAYCIIYNKLFSLDELAGPESVQETIIKLSNLITEDPDITL